MGVAGFMVLFLSSALGWGWGGPMMGLSGGGWELVLIGALVILTALVILAGAISRVAPTNTNRIMPFRITYTVYLILTLGGSFLISRYLGTSAMVLDTLPVLMVFVHYFFFLTLIVISTCGRDNWGLRLKRTIPNNLILRCLLFPFYSGAINGIVWLIGIAGVLLVGLFGAAAIVKSGRITDPSDVHELLMYAGTWAIMTYAFCTLAMMLRIKLLRRQLGPEHTWLLAISLIGGFFAIYFTILILMTEQREQYGFDFETPTIERLLIAAVLWAILATLLFLPWAIRQLPKFTPK